MITIMTQLVVVPKMTLQVGASPPLLVVVQVPSDNIVVCASFRMLMLVIEACWGLMGH